MSESEGESEVETIAPWAIKSIGSKARDVATAAARREGVTVGQWLEKRIKEWQEAGSPVALSTQAPAAHAPPQPAANIEALTQAMQQARAMCDAAGISMPPAMAREALKAVREGIRHAAGLPPLKPRAKAEAGTAQSTIEG